MKKIVFAEPIGIDAEIAAAFSQKMESNGYKVIFFNQPPVSQSDLKQRIVDAEILVISNQPLAASTLKQCANLKLIAVAFTGVDHVPLDYCRENGITVCNAAGYSTNAVAELTMAMATNLLRRIVEMDQATRKGGTREGFLGGELNGKIFGIVGFGTIGQRVATLTKAYGCRVIVHTRTVKKVEGIEYVTLDKLFSDADIISLHLPATHQTIGLVNSNMINLMKPNAILINTARGPIVDCMALANALHQGRIAGAAIDVYDHEPPIEPYHPLLSAPNTLLLPHIAYATHEAIAQRTKIVMSNIEAWIKKTPQNVIV